MWMGAANLATRTLHPSAVEGLSASLENGRARSARVERRPTIARDGTMVDAPKEFLSGLLGSLGRHGALLPAKETAKLRFHRWSEELWKLADTQASRQEAKRQNLEALEVLLLRQKEELEPLADSGPAIQLLDYVHDLVRDEFRRGLLIAL